MSQRGPYTSVLEKHEERACKTCKGTFALVEFYNHRFIRKDGTEVYYRHRQCKACDNSAPRKAKNPDNAKRARQKYYLKKKSLKIKRCYHCSEKIPDNPKGYCVNCYIGLWLTSQWRFFAQWHADKPDVLIKGRQQLSWLRMNRYSLMLLPGVNLYPNANLKHKKFMSTHPELGFTLDNIEWRIKKC